MKRKNKSFVRKYSRKYSRCQKKSNCRKITKCRQRKKSKCSKRQKSTYCRCRKSRKPRKTSIIMHLPRQHQMNVKVNPPRHPKDTTSHLSDVLDVKVNPPRHPMDAINVKVNPPRHPMDTTSHLSDVLDVKVNPPRHPMDALDETGHTTSHPMDVLDSTSHPMDVLDAIRNSQDIIDTNTTSVSTVHLTDVVKNTENHKVIHIDKRPFTVNITSIKDDMLLDIYKHGVMLPVRLIVNKRRKSIDVPNGNFSIPINVATMNDIIVFKPRFTEYQGTVVTTTRRKRNYKEEQRKEQNGSLVTSFVQGFLKYKFFILAALFALLIVQAGPPQTKNNVIVLDNSNIKPEDSNTKSDESNTTKAKESFNARPNESNTTRPNEYNTFFDDNYIKIKNKYVYSDSEIEQYVNTLDNRYYKILSHKNKFESLVQKLKYREGLFYSKTKELEFMIEAEKNTLNVTKLEYLRNKLSDETKIFETLNHFLLHKQKFTI